MSTATETRAAMSSAEINDLPDSAFAHIEPGGTKDSEGKTTPRSLRHYPVHDEAHARDALGRAQAQINGGDADAKRIAQAAMPKIRAAARKFGIEVGDNDADDRASRTPLELLRRRRGSMRGKAERRGMLLEMRAKPDGTGGTEFLFEGYASVFDAPFRMWDPWGDEYTEIVRPGAFTRSLARADLDVPFLIGHDDSRLALARTRNGTMRLAQDSKGLHVEARMDGRRSDVRDLAYAVERGDMDEMSIGFVTEDQAWSDDWETRSMLSLDIHRGDVSSVPLAASVATAGSTMTALPAESLSRQAAEGRARGEIADNDSRPDFNVDGAPPYNAAAHGPSSIACPHDDCPVYAGGDGQRALNAQDARYCDQCGGSLYNADGLIVADDNGVVEEVGGSMADADLLSRRLRLLELA